MTDIAVYAGSFDPFTNGHMDIVKKAAHLFAHLYVVIATNTEKPRAFDAAQMRDAIERTLTDAGISNCTVCIHTGLTADFAEKVGASYLVRGLRNSLDYGYEENIAAVNRALCPALDTVYFRAENAALSSTLVRELCRYGDIRRAAAYVPAPVFAVLEARGK